MRCPLLLAIVCWALGALALAQPDDPSLPRVLLLGDSISIGYTPHVVRELRGIATVEHNPGNARHTGIGLEKLDAWLGDRPWDVIHFNWGLHDLCYRSDSAKDPNGRDKVNGRIETSLADYEANLDRLVPRLKATGAKLVWASTTIVPTGEPGRIPGDEVRYNEAAARVMNQHGVPINDLQALSRSLPKASFVGPGNVHYTKVGYGRLGEQVAASIRGAIDR